MGKLMSVQRTFVTEKLQTVVDKPTKWSVIFFLNKHGG